MYIILVTGDNYNLGLYAQCNSQSVAPAITLDDPSDTSSGIEFPLFLTKFKLGSIILGTYSKAL